MYLLAKKTIFLKALNVIRITKTAPVIIIVNALVLNKDNRLYEKYKEMLIYYLQMTDIQRAEILNEARKINMTFFDFINRVLRIQRKLKKKMKKPLKTM